MGRKPVEKIRIDNPEQKKQWVKVLTPIYIKNGLKKFTMDEIARILGTSKATLYKHFTSREEILELSLEVKLNEIGSFKDKLFDESLPYIDRYFTSIQIFFQEIAGISNEFLADLKNIYPSLWKRVIFFREYAVEVLKQFYQIGIEAGFFHDVDPAILVINDKLFFDAISEPDFLIEHKLSLQKAFMDYFTLRCNGLFKQGQEALNIDERVRQLMENISN